MFETKIYLDISNLPEKDIDFNDFVYILNIKEEKYKSLINKCLNIQFVDKKRMEPKDIQDTMDDKGGIIRARKIFGKDLDTILADMSLALVA
jgi:hypothetical protein